MITTLRTVFFELFLAVPIMFVGEGNSIVWTYNKSSSFGSLWASIQVVGHLLNSTRWIDDKNKNRRIEEERDSPDNKR